MLRRFLVSGACGTVSRCCLSMDQSTRGGGGHRLAHLVAAGWELDPRARSRVEQIGRRPRKDGVLLSGADALLGEEARVVLSKSGTAPCSDVVVDEVGSICAAMEHVGCPVDPRLGDRSWRNALYFAKAVRDVSLWTSLAVGAVKLDVKLAALIGGAGHGCERRQSQ